MFLDIVGQRVTIALARTVVSQFCQVVSLKLNAVDFVVTAQTRNHLVGLVLGQWVFTILIGGKFLVEILLGELLTPLLLCSERLGDGEERHNRSMVDAVELHLI